MNQSNTGHRKVVELNIVQILMLLLRNWWVIALTTLLFTLATWGVTQYLVPREYTASALFYVNNGAFAEDNRFSGSDMDASRSLAETYTVILTANQTLNAAIEEAGLPLSAEEAVTMVRTAIVGETELFQFSITARDPEQAFRLAAALEKVFPERIREMMPNSQTHVVQPSAMPTEPSAPHVLRNLVTGCMSGFVFACSALLMYAMFDVTIRWESDLADVAQIPVLTRVPEIKGGSDQFSPNRKMNPDVQEAYKTLRTKLAFATDFPSGCRVIGVCSAMAGEGKSTTSINLAYEMSLRHKRVLLVDCDLRRPSVHQKLSWKLKPGMSDHLALQTPVEQIVQPYISRKSQFDVICAGRVPPNPSELLSSPRLGKLFEQLRQEYDVIVVDLPPVGEVSDGIVLAKHTDGTVLVVRRNYCNRQRLTAAVEQFASMKARVLGIVFNCSKI